MTCMPKSGRLQCNRCFGDKVVKFDDTTRTENDWRITANPLAWGNVNPEVVILGFSKGPTQKVAVESKSHDDIAFDRGRKNLGKILAHVGLVPSLENEDYDQLIHEMIASPNGRFHFGSLVRCTIERYDETACAWKGSGGGMLDRFVSTSFGNEVTSNCITQYLKDIPSSVKLVVMCGMGTALGYVSSAKKAISEARQGDWQDLNEIAYTDGTVTFVHVEHFSSQGALIPNWLGKNDHPRARLGIMAKEAVQEALLRNEDTEDYKMNNEAEAIDHQMSLIRSKIKTATQAKAIRELHTPLLDAQFGIDEINSNPERKVPLLSSIVDFNDFKPRPGNGIRYVLGENPTYQALINARKSLMKMPNFGKVSLEQIEMHLHKRGLAFNE